MPVQILDGAVGVAAAGRATTGVGRRGRAAARRSPLSLQLLSEFRLACGGEVLELEIPHDQSRVLARLHDLAEVYEERVDDGATHVTAWVPQNAAHYFEKFLAHLLKRAKVS